MTFFDLLVTQLTDLFRIGLLVALVITTEQTRAQTGRVIPLAVGLLFVAFLIATTTGATAGTTTMMAIVVGVVANAIILAIILAALELWSRFAAPKTPD